MMTDPSDVVPDEFRCAFPELDDDQRFAILRVLVAALQAQGVRHLDPTRCWRAEAVLRASADLLRAFLIASRLDAPS
jgi:hypothetical protein